MDLVELQELNRLQSRLIAEELANFDSETVRAAVTVKAAIQIRLLNRKRAVEWASESEKDEQWRNTTYHVPMISFLTGDDGYDEERPYWAQTLDRSGEIVAQDVFYTAEERNAFVLGYYDFLERKTND